MEAGEEMGEDEGEDGEEEEEEFTFPPIRDRAERSRAGMIPIFAFFLGGGGGAYPLACAFVCLGSIFGLIVLSYNRERILKGFGRRRRRRHESLLPHPKK